MVDGSLKSPCGVLAKCEVLRCSAVKSSVYNDRQFELDALGRSKPVKLKTGESICNYAPSDGDRRSTELPR